MSEKETIQKVLNELKRRTDIQGRAPKFLMFKDIEFVVQENYTKEQLNELRIIVLNSRIFESNDPDRFQFNDEGKKVYHVFDWNYQAYLDSLKPKDKNEFVNVAIKDHPDRLTDGWTKASAISAVLSVVLFLIFGLITYFQNERIQAQNKDIELLKESIDSILQNQD
jgi:hypothetical protein